MYICALRLVFPAEVAGVKRAPASNRSLREWDFPMLILPLVCWAHGRPDSLAAFSVAYVDLDNIIGAYADETFAEKTRMAMKRVAIMTRDIAQTTNVFVFWQVYKPRFMTEVVEAACVEHGFILVHCPRTAEQRDNVDAHMKAHLRRVVLAHTDDIPVTIFSGDHTFAEEVKIVGRTHHVYLGMPWTRTSPDLHNGSVRGRAWLLEDISASERWRLLMGTSTFENAEVLRAHVIGDPTWRNVHMALQISVMKLRRDATSFPEDPCHDPIVTLAQFLTNRFARHKKIGFALARALLEHRVVRVYPVEGSRTWLMEVNFNHPIFTLEAAPGMRFTCHLKPAESATEAAK